MILGVKIWRSYVERPLFWISVGEIRIDREQIHIMHNKIITFFLCLQESHIDQGSSVESETCTCISDMLSKNVPTLCYQDIASIPVMISRGKMQVLFLLW